MKYHLIFAVRTESQRISTFIFPTPLWMPTHIPGQNGCHFTDDIFKSNIMNEKFVLWFKIYWSLFLRFQLTRSPHWFKYWLGAEKAPSHYLNKCRPNSLTELYWITSPGVTHLSNNVHTLWLWFWIVWVISSTHVDLWDTFTHILQGCFTGTGTIRWLLQCHSSRNWPNSYTP